MITFKYLFVTVTASVIILAGLYVYLVNDTVWQMVQIRQRAEIATNVESELATLEAKYLTLTTNLTLAAAVSQGFIEPAPSHLLVLRQPVTVGLVSPVRNEL